jgi:transcriptional regulator with XRE-family HTH domain
MELSEAIRELRKSFNLTQPEFAKYAGLSEASVAHFESGSRRPDPVSLARLCRVAVDAKKYALANVLVKPMPGVAEGVLVPSWRSEALALYTPKARLLSEPQRATKLTAPPRATKLTATKVSGPLKPR